MPDTVQLVNVSGADAGRDVERLEPDLRPAQHVERLHMQWGSVRQDDQTERHDADCRGYSRSADKAKMECCAEVEDECGQAMYIARAT